jgi:hypothetical protein
VDFGASQHDQGAPRSSEESFRLILDSIPGLVHTLTPAGGVEFVNQKKPGLFW